MRRDLSAEQWSAVEEGQLTAPDGRTYHRRSTRLGRRVAADLVLAGCPVVTHWPGGGPGWTRVVWHDGNDAVAAWSGARADVTGDTPRPRSGRAVVTAGRWESPDGDAVAVVLTWHH